jgi:hypothetical protein
MGAQAVGAQAPSAAGVAECASPNSAIDAQIVVNSSQPRPWPVIPLLNLE